MRIVVDLNRCLGYAQCVPLAPEVLQLQGEEALAYDPNPDDSQRQRVARAVASCPVQAIIAEMDPPADRTTSEHAPAGRRSGHDLQGEGRIVIVGASLAGLRAAEALRDEGFTGSLTLIGDEVHEPYDRPPLSKQVLKGWVPAENTKLPRMRAIDADWRLGVAATGLDRDNREVLLANGDKVPYDRLLIATGVRSRAWFNPEEAKLKGLYTLRTSDDAAKLQAALKARPKRVLIVGAGFIGSEMASVCRDLGLDVTVAERSSAPLVGPLGGVIGDIAAKMQRDAGVDLRTGVAVEALKGDADGHVRQAQLSDGTVARRRRGGGVAGVGSQHRMARRR